jgi:DNA-binding transcriptional regulator YiaG
MSKSQLTNDNGAWYIIVMKEKQIPYSVRKEQQITQIMQDEKLDHQAATAKWGKNRKEQHKQRRKEMAKDMDIFFSLLEKTKMPIEAIAKLLNVSLKTIYRWKNGESCPRMKVLKDLRWVINYADLEKRVSALEKKLQDK